MWSLNSITTVDVLESYHVLHWLTHLIKPKSYLEVGVREGASLCCALAEEPEVIGFVMKCLMDGRTEITPDIIERVKECYTNRDPDMQVYIFDDWSDVKNSNGSRIRILLENGFNHRNYEIHDGDSKETLPQFFNELPQKQFPGGYVCGDKIDLVFIDGDHSLEGACSDLNNVAGKFRALVFHDLHHPEHSYLDEVFKTYVGAHGYPSFTVGKYRSGVGVAFDLT